MGFYYRPFLRNRDFPQGPSDGRPVIAPPLAHATRGYVKMYVGPVQQANGGTAPGFLTGRGGFPAAPTIFSENGARANGPLREGGAVSSPQN
jgi:hypothetical protein